MKVDWLVVGAGFTGATIAERIARELQQTVLVVDRRDHIAGNAFDEYDEHGVLVHRYGPHIFHTNSKQVWEYLSRFTEWRPYVHKVLAAVGGKLVPVPFNLNSVHSTLPGRFAQRVEEGLVATYGLGARVPILRLREDDDPTLREFAEFVYSSVFLGYTTKQWGLDPTQLDASVTGRVPVVVGRDDRYFSDRYQGIPRGGYTQLIRRMLQDPRIRVLLNADFRSVADDVSFRHLVYTGPIDEFFDFRFGALPYRSLRFHFSTHQGSRLQEVATVNYPNEHDFTRSTEAVHLTGQTLSVTTVTTEYPEEFALGENDRYYPIPRKQNRELYGEYRRLADEAAPSVVFAGRLADYKYYNMDQAVARALSVFDDEIVKRAAT